MELFDYQTQDHEHWGPIYMKALTLATTHHGEQTDHETKAPYMFHLLRVSHRLQSYEAKIVGLLHDIIEDTEVTLDDLRAMEFPDVIVQAVYYMTHISGTSYYAYVAQIANDAENGVPGAILARQVKIADLMDNMHIRRDGLAQYNDRNMQRLKKYRRAWRILMGHETYESDEDLD